MSSPQEHPHRLATHASTEHAVPCEIQFKDVRKPPTRVRAAQVSSAEWRSLVRGPGSTLRGTNTPHTGHTFGIGVGRERGDGRPSSTVALWRGGGRRGGGRAGWVCAGERHRAALGLLAVLHRLEQPRRVWTGRHRCSTGLGSTRAAGSRSRSHCSLQIVGSRAVPARWGVIFLPLGSYQCGQTTV